MGRFTIILVVGFAIIAGLMRMNHGRLSREAQNISSKRYVETCARSINRSIVNLCLYQLSQDFDWRDGYTNQNLQNGVARAIIEDSSDDSTLDLNHVRITATSVYGDTTATSIVIIRKSAFSEFLYFSNSEPMIYFITGDTLAGPMHTNGQFHIYGNPVFYGLVSSCSKNWYGWGNPEFKAGTAFGSPGINLPIDLSIIEGKAQSGGICFQGETSIEFLADGSFNWTVFHKERTGHPPRWQTVIDSSGNTVISSTNGVIATVNEANLHVQGTLNGQATVLSDGNIYIEDDVLYNSNPLVDPTSTDMLGLIARQNVIVANNAANRNNCSIYATIMALDRSFTVENYNRGSYRGQLEIVGGIVQEMRGPVGTMWHGVIKTGYQKKYTYDQRFLTNAPPFYPVFSKNSLVSWYE